MFQDITYSFLAMGQAEMHYFISLFQFIHALVALLIWSEYIVWPLQLVGCVVFCVFYGILLIWSENSDKQVVHTFEWEK